MSAFEETTIVADDLTQIEGIGPVVAAVLADAGISSFAVLAAMPTVKIKEILSNAGAHFSFRDPSTWAKQASLADSGQWDRLATWQQELQGGRIHMASSDPGEEE